CSVRLDLDDAAQAYLTSLAATRRATEQAKREHDLQVLRERQAAATPPGRQDTERAAADHDMLLKRQRKSIYQEALDEGTDPFLVLQLIEHPEDIKYVLGMLQDRQNEVYRKAREVFGDLSTSKLVIQPDVELLGTHVMNRLIQVLDPTAREPG